MENKTSSNLLKKKILLVKVENVGSDDPITLSFKEGGEMNIKPSELRKMIEDKQVSNFNLMMLSEL